MVKYVRNRTIAIRNRRRLLSQQSGKCAECGRLLVEIKRLNQRKCEVVFNDDYQVCYRDDEGVLQTKWVATVDHKISKHRWALEGRSGSPHQFNNLVVLCRICHDLKTKRELKYIRQRFGLFYCPCGSQRSAGEQLCRRCRKIRNEKN